MPRARYPVRVVEAVILSIGTELATGQQPDTNAGWLAAELTRDGVRIAALWTVGDERDAVSRAFAEAAARAPLVLSTGGLGPTADDVTREALAEAFRLPLETNADALRHVEAFFSHLGRPMPASNAVQAMVPRGCEVIPNERGTAPGIRGRFGAAEVWVLPGVPSEMKVMFRRFVAPAVAARTGGGRGFWTRLHCFGITEAHVGEALTDLMERGRNPLVGTSAARAVITIRILGRGADADEAERLVRADVAEIRRRLGSAVFGEEDQTLEAVVGRMLAQRRKTLATAESCTGGLLSARLTDVPGSSGYFLQGVVTYTNAAKVDRLRVPKELIEREGAVSEAVAAAMAEGCCATAGADYGLSITGIAGPTGGSPEKPVGLVYIGVADMTGVTVKRVRLGQHLERGEIRDRACSTALNLLRLRLLEAPRAD